MTLPNPYDAVAGAQDDPAIGEALLLAQNYSWLVRLTGEMDAEDQSDVKRGMQVIQHAAAFRVLVDKLAARAANEGKVAEDDYAVVREQGDVVRTIEGVFLLKKAPIDDPAAILSDLAAAAAKYDSLADFLKTSLVTTGAQYATLKILAFDDGGMPVVTDDPVKVEKPADLSGLLQDAMVATEARAVTAARK